MLTANSTPLNGVRNAWNSCWYQVGAFSCVGLHFGNVIVGIRRRGTDGIEAMTGRALELLGSKRNDAYEAALVALREDTQAWWADTLAGDPETTGTRTAI
jgi:hypothetical protein